jgi:hypothetical protein
MVYGQITSWLCPSVAQIAKSFDKDWALLGPSLCYAFGQVGLRREPRSNRETGMNVRLTVTVFSMVTLGGCASMATVSQDQTVAAKFSTGAHSVDAAQSAFLKQVQAVDCAHAFYTTARQFTKNTPNTSLDLNPPCQSTQLTDAQLQKRQQLMDAIAAYADGIQSLLTGTTNQSMATVCESAAKNIQTSGLPDVTSTETAAANTMVTSLAQVFLDHRESADIKSIATQAEPTLEIIVNTLKNENTQAAIAVDTNLDDIKNYFFVAVAAARIQKGEASLMDIASAHATLQSLSVTADATSLNKSLDALIAANKSLTTDDKVTAMQRVSDLITVGKSAEAIYNASK